MCRASTTGMLDNELHQRATAAAPSSAWRLSGRRDPSDYCNSLSAGRAMYCSPATAVSIRAAVTLRWRRQISQPAQVEIVRVTGCDKRRRGSIRVVYVRFDVAVVMAVRSVVEIVAAVNVGFRVGEVRCSFHVCRVLAFDRQHRCRGVS